MTNSLFSSFQASTPPTTHIHPTTGEAYNFHVLVGLFQYKHDKQPHARIDLVCWRGIERVSLMAYVVEPMNPFSLFAFASQYRELCENWISTSPVDHKITTAMKCFAAKKGPVIKISGKEVKGLDLEIVEVEG